MGGLRLYPSPPPIVERRRGVTGRWITTTPALFPNYLFLLAREGRWWSARWSVGVVALLMDGSTPARLADSVVDAIRARERDGLIELPKAAALAPGDPVRVTSGPLVGLAGLVAGLRGSDRVAILLNVLGRVELARAAIERA
jgi:transcriptional antiterminator RfaH